MFYERITPVTGNILRDKCVGIINADLSLRVIQFLASCGVVRFKVKENEKVIDELKEILGKHNENEEYEISILDDLSSVDLIVGIITDSNENCFAKVNYLVGAFSVNGQYSINFNKIPGEIEVYEQKFYFNWLDLSNQLAHYAVALLLEGSYWEQTELINYLNRKKQFYSGNLVWPWCQVLPTYDLSLNSLSPGRDGPRAIPNRPVPKGAKIREKAELTGSIALNKSILIAGCGSIGSVIAGCLGPLVSNMILIDPKEVSPYNPVRQEYHSSQVGHKKVFALAENIELSPALSVSTPLNDRRRGDLKKRVVKKENLEIVPLVTELDSEKPEEFIKILEKEKPDLVVLATGTTHEYELAEILREKSIPHITLRCYPRARWFEIIIVIPPFTPCFSCIRGHLYVGPVPSLTPEQEARYDPDYKGGQLEAEPAIKPDSARCAEVASRIVYQMLSEERENWFTALLMHNKTVLIGGNRVEVKDNDFCYGIKDPGQVVAFGLENLNGAFGNCLFCGNTRE